MLDIARFDGSVSSFFPRGLESSRHPQVIDKSLICVKYVLLFFFFVLIFPSITIIPKSRLRAYFRMAAKNNLRLLAIDGKRGFVLLHLTNTGRFL